MRLEPELASWVRACAPSFGGQSALINAAVRDLRSRVEEKRDLFVEIIGGTE